MNIMYSLFSYKEFMTPFRLCGGRPLWMQKRGLNTLGHQAFPAEVGNEHLAVKMIDGSGNGRGIRPSGAMLTWCPSRVPVRDGRAPARGCRKAGRNTTADARYDR